VSQLPSAEPTMPPSGPKKYVPIAPRTRLAI
jgi:hypothetical protein